MEGFRESATPLASRAGAPFSFPMLLSDAVRLHGHRVAFSDHVGGSYRELSFTECLFWSNAIAQALTIISKMPRCVIFSESRIEWPAAFFGVLGAGGIVVPSDSRSTAQELADFLRLIEPTVLMVSPRLLAVAEEAMDVARWRGTVMIMCFRGEGDDRAISALRKRANNFSLAQRNETDIAIIASTAGTCGEPKSVQLSLGNIFHQMWSLREAMALKPGDALMSVMPLSNIIEITGNLFTAFASGCHVHFPRSLLAADMKNAMRKLKITHMIVVPRMMQFAENLIKSRFKAQYGAEGPRRLDAMQDISRAARNTALRRHLSRPILNEMGPYLRRVLVCGATLNTDTLKFFHFMGIDVLQSYGLVESCGLATVNLRKSRFGSTGPCLPGCAVRINATGEAKVGEILIRGPHLFHGYYARGNVETFPIDDEGWLHTGDLGFLSHDLFLYVIDRKHHVIVLEDGREVYPLEVEKLLLNSSLFEQVCVTGLNNNDSSVASAEQVCAVVVPKIALRKLKSPHELQILCEKEVSRVALSLPEFKRPQRVIVRAVNMSVTRSGTVKVTLLENP